MKICLKAVALCSLTVLLSACGGGGSGSKIQAPLANTHAYHPDAPNAATVLSCAKAESPSDSCTLAQLAPIGFANTTPTVANPMPTIDDVMTRVLVSHTWMGQRFEELLSRMPEDILYLLGGVTAIVIDDDIRPSYYTSLTGAIYLDPEGLWLTEQERADVSSAPDYRKQYAEVMAFRSLWRYVVPGSVKERTLDELEYDLAALLFHELAHANDIFPRSYYLKADINQSFLAITDTISKQTGDNSTDNYLSALLNSEQPLASAEMKRIADILYNGHAADAGERLISAAQVGEHLESDGANDDYAYTSQFEDLAMLFEEAMMKLHYGADRDLVFANLPAAEDSDVQCNDYTVGWGVRNRLGDDLVKPRARWAVSKLLPHKDYSLLFDTLEQPSVIPPGLGWCQSETFNMVAPAHFQKSTYKTAQPEPFDPKDALRRSELRMP